MKSIVLYTEYKTTLHAMSDSGGVPRAGPGLLQPRRPRRGPVHLLRRRAEHHRVEPGLLQAVIKETLPLMVSRVRQRKWEFIGTRSGPGGGSAPASPLPTLQENLLLPSAFFFVKPSEDIFRQLNRVALRKKV
jgi:hypothetical protein